MPIDHTSTALPARPNISAKRTTSPSLEPARRASSASGRAPTEARSASKPVVCDAMKSRSTSPRSMSTFVTAAMKAASPPVWTGKNSSVMRVPKTALSALDGTQYRSSPGSRSGLTTATRVPRRRASYRYFMNTGCAFATSVPNSTTRSVSRTSR
jgi:hypothetical protein